MSLPMESEARGRLERFAAEAEKGVPKISASFAPQLAADLRALLAVPQGGEADQFAENAKCSPQGGEAVAWRRRPIDPGNDPWVFCERPDAIYYAETGRYVVEPLYAHPQGALDREAPTMDVSDFRKNIATVELPVIVTRYGKPMFLALASPTTGRGNLASRTSSGSTPTAKSDSTLDIEGGQP